MDSMGTGMTPGTEVDVSSTSWTDAPTRAATVSARKATNKQRDLFFWLIAATVLVLIVLRASAASSDTYATDGMDWTTAALSSTSTPTPTPTVVFTALYTSTHFTVYGTLNCTTNPNDCLLGTYQAKRVADNMEVVWTKLNTYSFSALKNHYDVRVYDMGPGLLGWCCDAYMHIDAYQVRKSDSDYNLLIDTETVPAHEFFHSMQKWRGDGAWFTEGQASWSEDAFFANADAYAGCSFAEDMAWYLARPNKIRADPPAPTPTYPPSGLKWSSYDAGLWWKYVGEQYGTVRTEPETGIDVVRDVWNTSNSVIGADAMDSVLKARGSSMRSAFRDFVVANYTKQLNTTGLAAKYFYQDEKEATNQVYPAVHIETTDTITPGTVVSYTNQGLADWGAVYHRANPSSNCPMLQVRLTGKTAGIQQAYAVLAIRNKQLISDSRYVGDKYSIAIFNSPAISEVMTIVAGLEQSGSYDVSFSCVSPSVNIISPLQSAPALAGDPANPRRVMVQVEVTGPTGEFVEGLPQSAFTVQVDGQDATILSSAYVMKQYWMVIRLPTGLAAGLHNLSVSVAGASDSEPQSILLKADGHYDEVLVVDRSGSMIGPTEYPKIQAAKNAARLYVDELADNDRVGVVSFSTTATSDYNLTPVNDTVRTQAKNTINGMYAGGWTTLGGGLMNALTQTTSYGLSANPDVFVLLSDGEENTWPCWEYHAATPGPPKDCSTGPYISNTIKTAGVKVHTVALGPDADQQLMQKIATTTGGTYRYAQAPSTSSSSVGVEQTSTPGWMTHLADVYDYLAGVTEARQRLAQASRTQTGSGASGHEIYIDDSVSLATFAVAQEKPRSSGCEGLNWRMTLRRPNGQVLIPGSLPAGVVYRDDPYHGVFQVTQPEPGWWVVGITSTWQICSLSVEPEQQTTSYRLMVGGQTDLGLNLYLPRGLDDRQVGIGMPILGVLLGPHGPLPATMTAWVTDPVSETTELTLYDDGLHNDGAANDQIYGTLYSTTSRPGSYQVQLRAQHDQVIRWAFGAFYVAGDRDSDDDGIPDSWERRVGLDPGRNDANADPDGDGLSNLDEFRRGTNPFNDDSDGGGERDGAEIICGLDPHNASDDLVSPPGGMLVQPGNGYNELRFSVHPSLTHMLMQSSTDPSFTGSEWTPIAPTGVYTQTGLTNNVPVYYRLAALVQARCGYHISRASEPVAGVPRQDTTRPEGTLRINGAADVTFSRTVTLTIEASPDTARMMIANSPDFAGASWEPYRLERSWTLANEEGVAHVFARLMDQAGNLSRVIADDILVIGPQTTQIYVSPGHSSVGVSDTITVELRIANISNLYGAQVEMSFNPALLQVVDAYDFIPGVQIYEGEFPTPDVTLLNTVDNARGRIYYTVSLRGDKPGVSGGGVLARIVFHGRQPGADWLVFTRVVLSDPQSRQIPAVTLPGAIAVHEARGTVAGWVRLERRASNAGSQVCVGNNCVTTPADGSYLISGIQPGFYTVTVSHMSYLRSYRPVTVPLGMLTLPTVTLLGGDVNQDGRIGLPDGAIIGQAWNSTPASPTWDERADITDDDTVNILDAVAVQFNLDKTAPGPWPGAGAGHLANLAPAVSAHLDVTTQVAISPSLVTLTAISDTASLDIRVLNVTNLYAARVQVSFNPRVLRVRDADPRASAPGVQVRPGDFLDVLNQYVLVNSADNTTGLIDFAVTQTYPATGQTGSGTLASIVFEVVGPGNSAIHLLNVQLLDDSRPDPVEIPASLQDGQVSVQVPSSLYLPVIIMNSIS